MWGLFSRQWSLLALLVSLAIGVNTLLFPLLALPSMWLLSAEMSGGLIVTALVPRTLASVAVWTRKAGGDDATAMVVSVVTDLACFIVAPLGLWLVFGRTTVLSPQDQIVSLLLWVVIPLVLGQWLRRGALADMATIIYHVGQLMRDVLDPIDPELLNGCFLDIFYELQHGRVLKDFVFDDGFYLVAIDGTGHFCSTTIRCEHCSEKVSKGVKTQYRHQAVVGTLVHPDRRETFPLAIEPIVKQDGENKNDCERNATRRLLKRLRQQHPKLKMMIVEDGLASIGSHIHVLKEWGFSFLLGAKPGDHKHLFDQFIQANDRDEVETTTEDLKRGGLGQTQYARGLPLNASQSDVKVNLLPRYEYNAAGDAVL